MSGSNSAERKRHEPLVLVETADLSEEDWLDYRRRGIGGSDVSAIFGTSPFRTARDLYYDKLNIASVEDDEGNWVAMEMGHLLEPLVAKIFERKTGYRVYQIKKMFQHPQYPWMLADVDYFVELPDGTTAILEIKTTNYNARDNWWMNGKETVPVYYESQGRHYMAVTDLDRCFFCCLYGNNEEEVIIREVKRDLEYEAEMVFLEQYFWENHVQRHVPPPYTESGALIIESARKHFGPADKNAPAVALDLDMTAKLMQYLRLLDEKKNAEVYSKEIDKDIQRLKALLIAEMGTSCTAVCEQEGVNYTVTYLESVVTALKKDGLLRTYYRDKLRGYRLGPRAKATLLDSRPDRFASYLTGDTDTNRLKCEIDRRLRLHRLAETYMTMDNAGVCVYRDEKPAIFAPEGYAGGRIVYPAFFSSREVKEMGIDTTKIRSSRSTGILLAPSGIFVTYNSSSALMKWRYKSEMRVKALIWSVICQQRLSPQFRHEDVHGLILGNSMDLAYQILTSTGGRKHDFFMLDGSYEHFLYLTNDHQGEVILALLCDPGKTAELDRILLQGLTARQPGLAIEHDGISPDGSPVLFGYFCDLPRIARFNTSLELSERPGTLICFDFQAEVLRSYCGSRMRFQTIDFTKFEGRLFP